MSDNKSTALEFINAFCETDLEALESLLSEDLQFVGSFFQFNTREEYINSLKNGALEKSHYALISVTDNPDHVAVFYKYIKPESELSVAQLFTSNLKKSVKHGC